MSKQERCSYSLVSEILIRNACLGIDIDTKNPFELVRRYYNAKYITGKKVVIEETEKGYHLRIEGVPSSP